MFSDMGSRNRLSKRVKIAAFKTNESKETKKRSQRTRGENGGVVKYKVGMRDKTSNMGHEVSEGLSDEKRQFIRKRTLGDGENGGSRKDYRVRGEGMLDRMREGRPFISNFSGKRIYADRETNADSRSNDNAEGFEKRARLGKRYSQVGNEGVVKVKDSSISSRTMWGSVKLEGVNSEDKPSSQKVKSGVRSDRVSDEARGKGMNRKELVEEKQRSKSKSDSSKSLFVSKKKNPEESLLSSGKKKIQVKKRLGEDPEGLEEKPMKTKRVIRIARSDISNKRLDDGIADNDIKKEKKNDLEEKHEMSKNAQFRAIQPSSSILSYVEDNLLGRRRLIELRRAGYNTELSAPLDNIPNSTSSERERIEENVFRNKLTFFAAAKVSSSFPQPELPEIAFAGRSNVGKSSLLNSLTRQWGVARTSDKPGLTQTINFFNLGSKLCLVDLPGYGFAYAKEEVKDSWEELVKEYVSTRAGLKRVCLLIDTKWGMKQRDHELIDLMERAQTKYQIVLTKTDVVFPIDVARRAMQIEETLKAHKSVVQPVMMVSSKSGAGIRSLRTVLAKIGRFAKL